MTYVSNLYNELNTFLFVQLDRQSRHLTGEDRVRTISPAATTSGALVAVQEFGKLRIFCPQSTCMWEGVRRLLPMAHRKVKKVKGVVGGHPVVKQPEACEALSE